MPAQMHRTTILRWACAAILIAIGGFASAYENVDRWNFTATDGGTGSEGAPVTITWSIVDDGVMIPGESGQVASDLIEMLDDEFGSGPGGNNYALRPWFSIFSDSFDRLSELAGITYVYEPNDDGAAMSSASNQPLGELGVRGDVRIAGRHYTNFNTLASNYYPDHGDMIISTRRGSYFDDTANNFRAFRNTIMHEALHGVGVDHISADSSGFLMRPTISTNFDGPQLDDILAMQRLYGDVYEKNGGNNSYSSATPLGAVSTLQTLTIGQNGSSTLVDAGDIDFVSIDDNSDFDYFSFTLSEALNIVIDVVPQGTSYLTGAEGQSASSFDSRMLSDLAVTLFDSNGLSIIQNADANGIGGAESVAASLNPGTYYTRVRGGLQDNNIQLYRLTVAAAADPQNLVWTGSVDGTWDLQGTANFNNGGGGDVFNQLDSVTFDDTAQRMNVTLVGSLNPAAVVFNAASDYVLSGSGSITSGSLTINGSGTVELASSGNSYSGPTQINGGTLLLTGDTSAMVTDITIAAGGTLIMDSSLAGGNSSTFFIEPGGTLQVGRELPNSNADVFPNNPVSVVNQGTVRIVDFESVSNISGSGQIVAAAELALLDGNSHTGQTIVESDGAIQPTDNNAFGSTSSNTVVQSGGYIVARNDDFGPASLTLDESFVLSGTGIGAGALQVTQATTVVVNGDLSIAATGAEITVSNSSSLTLAGSFDASAGPATLEVANGSALLINDAEIGPGGLAKNETGTVVFSGAMDFQGPIDINEGSVDLTGAGSVSDSVRLASLTTLGVSPSVAFDAASQLTGDGAIVGDLIMPGTIAPGNSGIGALDFIDSLILADTSILLIELGGVAAGEFDAIQVGDAALLDGMLTVELTDLGGGVFTPQQGDAFEFLVAQTSISGFFDSFSLPTLDLGLAWETNVVGTSAFLEVVAVASADANNDGTINGADFLAHQRDSTELIPQWQSSYGGGPAPVSVVPEPTAAWLALAALAIGILSRSVDLQRTYCPTNTRS